ncbi:MAG TPA: UbiA family prenyltransferase, partial [Myxococcota bacterium]
MRALATVASIARIHIVAIGALGTLTLGFALTGLHPWALALVSGCDWFIVNLLNRVVDLEEDAANGIDGTALVAKHKRAVLVIGFGALALSFAATAILAPMLLPLRAAFHALGFAYNWPLRPGWRRLKQLAFWKNTASATGFLLTVFAYPLALNPAPNMRALATLASIARIHIVAIGALGTLTLGFALTGSHPWALALVSGCDWFIDNLLNRVVDLEEDAKNGIDGTALVAKHKRAVLVIGFSALALSFALTALWAPALLPLRAAFHALGFAYNWPLRPGWRRIKQLAFWKNTASATGFLLTVFAYPLALYPRALDVTDITLACTGAFFFLFELSYEVLYDLRDVDGDRVAHVNTWPALLGVTHGWRIAMLQMLASFAVIAIAFALALVPWRIAVMGAAPLIQLAFVAWVHAIKKRS